MTYELRSNGLRAGSHDLPAIPLNSQAGGLWRRGGTALGEIVGYLDSSQRIVRFVARHVDPGRRLVEIGKQVRGISGRIGQNEPIALIVEPAPALLLVVAEESGGPVTVGALNE